jgi:hypothetical protein
MDIEAMHSEALHISNAMIKYGGSFVSHLGYALQHADAKNTQRIRHAFPDYWEDYKKKAADDAARESKETRIDSMSDEDWDARMKKTAQLAAEGQKVI